MSDIKYTSDASFEQDVLKSSTPVLVDYWAEWCGPWLALLLSVGIWHLDSFYDRFRCDSIQRPRAASLIELLKLGLPIGLSTVFEVTSFTFMAVLIARLGATAVAGHQIVANLVALLFMMPLSLGIATSTLVAQSLGAGSPRAARSVTRRGYAIAMTLAVSAALLLWALRETVVNLYTKDAGVAAMPVTVAVSADGTSVHQTGPKEWQARIGKIPVAVA